MSQGFPNATKAMCKAGLAKESMRMRKLKRENAAMKRWLKCFIYRANDSDANCQDNMLNEIRRDMPGLFKKKGGGKMINQEETMDIDTTIGKIGNANTMPELDALRTETAEPSLLLPLSSFTHC